MMMIRQVLALGLLWTLGGIGGAQEQPGGQPPGKSGEAKPPASEAPKKKEPQEVPAPKVTQSQVTLPDGKRLSYKAEAGVLQLENEKEEPKASVFYVAYEVDPAPGTKRPVMFCFNGGPGSSAVWLHLGLLGPRRVDLPGEGIDAPRLPCQVVENAETVLGVCDLVFVDPVSTGYSRAVEEKEAKEFHGYEKDVESVSEFIRRWITEKGRWGSPKYLIGESYGAIRVTGVADYLQSRVGMYLNGVVLLSGLLDFATLHEARGNDLPFVVLLPSYATVAHYFGKLGEDLQKRSREEVAALAREFALGAYASGLLQGGRLAPAARGELVRQLARFTGLPEDLVERSDLRVKPGLFRKQLLWKEREVIGRFDARVRVPDRDPEWSHTQGGDAALDRVLGAYSGAMKDYLRRELQYESKLSYEILSPRVHPWSYEPFENRYVNVTETLEEAMLQNEHLRVLMLCGYEDLATPFAGMEQSVAQLDLPAAARKGIRFAYYEGGHMMYTLPASRKLVSRDLLDFLAKE